MRFKSVTIQNFLSFGSPPQEVSLDSRGLVAVFGVNEDAAGADSNGAGKSTLMESLVWCLYGETLRGYRGDSVVNRKAGKDCFVEVAIEDGGTVFVVRRTRKAPGAKANDLTVTINGTKATQGTVADTQSVVQTILGMDCRTFTQSVLMSSGSRSFSQMNDSDQKSVLEDILQIDKLSKAKDLVKKRVSAKQSDLSSTRANIVSLETRKQDAESTLRRLQTQRDQHDHLVRQRWYKTAKAKAEAEVLIEEIYSKTGLGELLKHREELRKEDGDLSVKRSNVQTTRIKITRTFAAKRAEMSHQEGELQGRLAQIGEESAALDQITGQRCYTCKQLVTPESTDTVMAAWEREAGTIHATHLKKLSRKQAQISRSEKRQLNELHKNEISIDSEWTTNQAQLRIANDDVSKRQASLSLVCRLEKQVQSFQAELTSLDSEENPYFDLIVDSEKSISRMDADLRKLSYHEQAITLDLDHLNYWNQGFSNKGLKSYILDSVVPFLTKSAQGYADILSDGDLKIEFTTQTQLKSGEWREKFQVKVVNRQGADVYHGNSEGEKRRIDVAVGWALADLAASRAQKSIRFRALDEPFESLDETGEDAVIKLLHKVVPQYETIMCVTHSTGLRNQFPEEIIVKKENGVSIIL